jgi:hypothetical protein
MLCSFQITSFLSGDILMMAALPCPQRRVLFVSTIRLILCSFLKSFAIFFLALPFSSSLRPAMGPASKTFTTRLRANEDGGASIGTVGDGGDWAHERCSCCCVGFLLLERELSCVIAPALDFKSPSHLFIVQFFCRMLHMKLAAGEAVIVEFEVPSRRMIVVCVSSSRMTVSYIPWKQVLRFSF